MDITVHLNDHKTQRLIVLVFKAPCTYIQNFATKNTYYSFRNGSKKGFLNSVGFRFKVNLSQLK